MISQDIVFLTQWTETVKQIYIYTKELIFILTIDQYASAK